MASPSDLDWLPKYPTPLRRRGVLAAVVIAQNISPIPNAPPPTELTWRSAYPDFARSRIGLRPAAQRTYTRLDGPPFADVRWKATYPDRIVRLRMLPATQSAWHGPNFYFIQVPRIAQWRPTYPSRIWTKPPLVGGQSVWRVDPTIIIAAANCVEWVDGAVSRPELTTEGVTRPIFGCSTEVGFLLLEDGGFILLEDGGKIELEDQSSGTCESVTRPQMLEEDLC